MPGFNGGFEIHDDEDIKLLEVRHKRKARVNVLEPNQSNPPPQTQTQATLARTHLFHEILNRFRSKTRSKNNMNEETNATSRVALEDKIMTDTMTELTEKDCVKLPSLLQVPPEPQPQENIDRPYYNDYFHCEGFVAWWDNRTGKGMIIDHHYSLEHKIELKDIKSSNYGALVPGSMVEYEYFNGGINKGFSKFWVVSGCEYVL